MWRFLGIMAMVVGLYMVNTDGWRSVALAGVFGFGCSLFAEGILVSVRAERKAADRKAAAAFVKGLRRGVQDGRWPS